MNFSAHDNYHKNQVDQSTTNHLLSIAATNTVQAYELQWCPLTPANDSRGRDTVRAALSCFVDLLTRSEHCEQTSIVCVYV